jgi:hypothetical protein
VGQHDTRVTAHHQSKTFNEITLHFPA